MGHSLADEILIRSKKIALKSESDYEKDYYHDNTDDEDLERSLNP